MSQVKKLLAFTQFEIGWQRGQASYAKQNILND